jgi:hypothetical protein
MKRAIGILAGIVVVVWIVSNPAIAGDTVHSWVTGLITFFQHLI